MTDEIEAMAKRLEAYAKDQGGWHNIDETCAEAAAALRRLAGETFHRHSAHVAAEEERGAWKARATAAEQRAEAAENLLRGWQSCGCPYCGGDCSSANPPVSLCLMRDTGDHLANLIKEPGHE